MLVGDDGHGLRNSGNVVGTVFESLLLWLSSMVPVAALLTTGSKVTITSPRTPVYRLVSKAETIMATVSHLFLSDEEGIC